jgi:hypothetical protein
MYRSRFSKLMTMCLKEQKQTKDKKIKPLHKAEVLFFCYNYGDD